MGYDFMDLTFCDGHRILFLGDHIKGVCYRAYNI